MNFSVIEALGNKPLKLRDRFLQSLVNKLRVNLKLDTGLQTVQCFATPLAMQTAVQTEMW